MRHAIAAALLIVAAEGYTVDPAWPKKPADLAWGEMPGVAVDAKDQCWIFTRAKPAIQVFAADGAFVKSLDIENKRSHHVKFDPEGNFWVADIGFHVVRKYATDGKLLLSLGTPDAPGVDETHFDKPTDMTVTPAGDIFVSDGYGNNRVVHFDKGGKFVKSWGKKGTGPGEFDLPHGIGVDSKGRLYVADRSNGRVQVFEQSGKFVAEWRDVMVPWSIWVTAQDEVWVCGSSPTAKRNDQGMMGIPPHDQLFVRFDASGKVLEKVQIPLGVEGKCEPGDLCWVHAVAPDSKGNLYAGDIKGKRVQKFVRRP
jgi:hypothetical protein